MVLKWKSEGLPGDSLSLENSVMIFNSSQTPFLIDPNSKATQWLKVHFKNEKNLEIISHAHPKFSTTFELSLRFGKTLIIEDNPITHLMFEKQIRLTMLYVFYITDITASCFYGLVCDTCYNTASRSNVFMTLSEQRIRFFRVFVRGHCYSPASFASFIQST